MAGDLRGAFASITQSASNAAAFQARQEAAGKWQLPPALAGVAAAAGGMLQDAAAPSVVSNIRRDGGGAPPPTGLPQWIRRWWWVGALIALYVLFRK